VAAICAANAQKPASNSNGKRVQGTGLSGAICPNNEIKLRVQRELTLQETLEITYTYVINPHLCCFFNEIRCVAPDGDRI
jgi:hypothetical protein